MRIWIACFFVLFAIAELCDWINHLSLPLPIHILGGLFLAIASNSDKQWSKFFSHLPTQPPSVLDSSPSGDRVLDEK